MSDEGQGLEKESNRVATKNIRGCEGDDTSTEESTLDSTIYEKE